MLEQTLLQVSGKKSKSDYNVCTFILRECNEAREMTAFWLGCRFIQTPARIHTLSTKSFQSDFKT